MEVFEYKSIDFRDFEKGCPDFGEGHSVFGGGHPVFGGGHPDFRGGHAVFGGGHPDFRRGHAVFGGGHPVFARRRRPKKSEFKGIFRGSWENFAAEGGRKISLLSDF